MLSLKDIRRRIGAVRNTQKVTRAMKLVAAAKLKSAQECALMRRAYMGALSETVSRVSCRLGNRAPDLWRRPLSLDCIDLVIFTSDRGLCGGFNENLMREVFDVIEDQLTHNIDVHLFVIGRKGLQALGGFEEKLEVVSTDQGIEAMVEWLSPRITQRYLSRESSGCNVVFNRFVSAARHEVTFWDLLPLYHRGDPRVRHLEYFYEPDRETVLERLAQQMIRRTLMQAHYESRAAELSARMMAMDGATRNADEMIAHLTSVYNRTRQDAITNELMDIVNGAEALR